MRMSLDEFMTGPNARPEEPLGDGGEQLHEMAFGMDSSMCTRPSLRYSTPPATHMRFGVVKWLRRLDLLRTAVGVGELDRRDGR